ncbi:extracellular solute-binding protein [Akkermansiaceae bacterium]|nr:extracellular solute-binding protein [Akkermansiaceae bacterium]
MKGSWKKYFGVFVPMAVVIAAPMILRDDETVGAGSGDLRLEVITPHNEAIRREFGDAFSKWYQAQTGKSVYVNWRTPGGTSEIKRVLDSAFTSAEANGKEGIGLDIFMGGGVFDFSQQASEGRFVKLDIFEKQAELFQEGVIPAKQSGEDYYPPEKDWLGVCLSSFGICYNLDSLNRRGLEAPAEWKDLGDPAYQKGIALADPTKSGSVAKAFEMLVQEQIHLVMKSGKSREESCEEGWRKGMNLIQRIGANARYFTDSASKVPHDVAQGDAVAGMCIDFYGRSYNESLKKADGRSRIEFVSPVGGTSISVDPVAILKGAPNEELAQEFVRFLYTKEGQMLWNARPGEEMGPRSRALRRLPIRKDLYQEPYLSKMIDAGVMPYEAADEFLYDSTLTGKHFSPLRLIIRVMCIDSHQEMKAAWEALIEADFPKEASEKFFDVSPIGYQDALDKVRVTMKAGDNVALMRMTNELGRHFRENYREAERLAKGGSR